MSIKSKGDWSRIRRCKCGNPITHHHWRCDKCWEKQQRVKRGLEARQ